MSKSGKVIYQLNHCAVEFWPTATYRLHCEPAFKKNYQYQDLMTGTCPQCQQDVFAWLGIDYLGWPIRYHSVNTRKRHTWVARMATDLVREHNKHAHNIVKGSILDKNSGRYRFCESIPVY